MAIDTNRAIFELLKLDAPLLALLGGDATRITSPTLRSKPTLPALAFSTIPGGETDPLIPLLMPVVQFDCWSKSSLIEARQLYRALLDYFHDKRATSLGANGFLLEVVEEGHGQDLVDPDTGWYRVLARFRFTFHKEAP